MKKTKSLFLIVWICIQVVSGVSGQLPASFTRSVETFKNDKDLENALIGLSVKDVSSGEVLADINRKISMAHASVQKLITTATILEMLSDTFRFETVLAYTGQVDSAGILHGQVYIKGGGDPALASHRFPDVYTADFFGMWADKLKSAGIRGIDGDICGDGSIYSPYIPRTWKWEDIGNFYGAAASGLTVQENKYSLFFNTPYQLGDTTKIVRIEPEIEGMRVRNEVVSSSVSYDMAYIFGAPFNDDRLVRGTLPAGRTNFEVKGSVPDPVVLAASLLKSALVSRGIAVSGESKSVVSVPDNHVVVARQLSPSLAELAQKTNFHSINLYAEHFLKHLSYLKTGYGEVDSGTEIMENFWKSKGISPNGMHLYDGCGLSRYNAMTPEQVTDILIYMKNKSKYSNVFFASIPVAGVSGTLTNIGRGTLAQGRVSAKSGTILGTLAYSGYVSTVSGRQLAFSMTVGGFNCSQSAMRQKFVNMMVAMAAL